MDAWPIQGTSFTLNIAKVRLMFLVRHKSGFFALFFQGVEIRPGDGYPF